MLRFRYTARRWRNAAVAQPEVQSPPFDRPWLIYDPQCRSCRVLLQLYAQWQLLDGVYVAPFPHVFRALPPAIREEASRHSLLFDPHSLEWWRDDALFDRLLALRGRPAWQRAWLQWQWRAIAPEPAGPSPLAPAALIPYLWVGLLVWAIVSMLWGTTVAHALRLDPLTGSRVAVAATGAGWVMMTVLLIALHQGAYHQPQTEGVLLLRQVITLMLISLVPLLAATLFTLVLTAKTPASRIWGLNAGFLLVTLGLVIGLFTQWSRVLDYPRFYPLLALASLIVGVVGVGWLLL